MLGEAFKVQRAARGLSLEGLAAQIGVSETYVRQIESGMRPQVSWELLRRSARALRMPLYQLVDAAWATAAPVRELQAAGLPEDRQEQLRALWPRIPRRLRPVALQAAFALARVETMLDGMSQRRDS